jgi:hypothetical protein
MVVEEVETFTEPNCFKERGAILHRLNREAINNKGQKVMLKTEDFQKTEKQWKDVPVLFGKEHPIGRARENLAKVLSENDLKFLGTVKEARVISEGSPRLEADFGELVQDKAFKAADKAGKVEISAGWSPSNDGPIPDHILLYESGSVPPGDKGAMFFQDLKEPEKFFSKMFNFFKEKVKEESEMADDVKDVQAKLDAANVSLKQKEADVAAFQDKIKALEVEKVEKEKALNAFQEKAKKDQLDSMFNLFQAKCPPGWKTGKVKVKDEKGVETEVEAFQELRKSFEKDMQGSYEKLYAHLKKTNDFQEGDAGAGDPNAGADSKPEKYPSVGRWDPMKRAYVDE